MESSDLSAIPAKFILNLDKNLLEQIKARQSSLMTLLYTTGVNLTPLEEQTIFADLAIIKDYQNVAKLQLDALKFEIPYVQSHPHIQTPAKTPMPTATYDPENVLCLLCIRHSFVREILKSGVAVGDMWGGHDAQVILDKIEMLIERTNVQVQVIRKIVGNDWQGARNIQPKMKDLNNTDVKKWLACQYRSD